MKSTDRSAMATPKTDYIAGPPIQEAVRIPETAVRCPHCRIVTHFTPKRKLWDPHAEEVWVIQSCDKCKGTTTMVYEQTEIWSITYEGRTGSIPKLNDYPKYIYPAFIPKAHKSIPSDIAEDYVEALKIYIIGAYNSSAVMCRRALQTSLIQQGATDSKLVKQIDELKGTKISESLADWAHEIREVGNIGAHSDKYEPRGVSKETAGDMIKFLEDYLEYIYIKPWKISERRKERLAKKPTT